MRIHFALLFATAAAAAAGCAGEDGTSYLTDLTDEAAGANCPTGGIRIDTGPDDNGNGTLDSGEVADTKYVCGNRTLTSVTPEPIGANCPAGGVKIEAGADANNNGMLETGEATSTNYICGSGQAVVTKTFKQAGVPVAAGLPTTVLSGTIQATSPGKVIAIGSSDLFCTSTECPLAAPPSPSASAYLWIADEANTVAPTADYDFVYLQPNLTQSLTRTSYFPIAAAGAYTFNLRGQDIVGDLTYYRSGLTLVFIP
ncbi:hypothetical protein BH11MYX3_BH11MYX3_44740 [soil metagenome]